MMWPPPARPAPVAPEPKKVEKTATDTGPVFEAKPVDPRITKLRSAMAASVGMSGLVGLGMVSPSPAFTQMLTTFGLSGIVGELW